MIKKIVLKEGVNAEQAGFTKDNKPVKLSLSENFVPYSGDPDVQQQERAKRIRERLGL